MDILWSDPQDALGYAPSDRGAGVLFGPDCTERFLEQEGLEMLVRSHQVREHGSIERVGGVALSCVLRPCLYV